jgi:hypothetical protein
MRTYPSNRFLGRNLSLLQHSPGDYYLNPNSIGDALRNRSPFNILHPATGYKLDIDVRKDEPFEREAFSRRVSYSLPDSPNEPVLLLSPEDIVLFKLRWYRLGNEVSEKEWSDILGELRTQRDGLDNLYLDKWAAAIGIKDLLDRIRAEV